MKRIAHLLFLLCLLTIPALAQSPTPTAADVVQLPVVDTPPADGSDPTADSNDPNMLRAQIVALKAIASSFHSKLAPLSDFKQFESAMQLIQEKQRKVSQLTAEAQAKKEQAMRVAHPSPASQAHPLSNGELPKK